MGGRLPVVWLVAVVVTMGFAGPLALAPASAQISVPLPGTDSRPRVVERKQIFRPTAPHRNPNRTAASVAAVAAPSTSSLSGAVIASAAGGLSAATGAVKADPTFIARTRKTAEAPSNTAALSDGAETDAGASDEDGIDTAGASEESPSDDPAPDAAAEESPSDESEAADVAPADDAATSESAAQPDDENTGEPAAGIDNASSGEVMLAASAPESPDDPTEKAEDTDTSAATDSDSAQADAMESEEPETAEPAASSDDTDTTESETSAATDTDTEVAETAETTEADQEPEPTEVAETPSDETTASDSTPAPVGADASSDESETADAEPADPADTKAAEAEEPAQETETAETAEASPDDNAAIESELAETAETETDEGEGAAEADEPAKTASSPSHDATVVLEVSPPPDEVIVAALTPADAETPSNEEAAEDVAALTSPSEPEPAAAEPETESETPAAAEPESEATEPESDSDDTDAAADSEEPKPDEAAETPANDDAPPDADAATATGEQSEEGETPDETAMEPAPPPPPPAHPTVATVRDTLAAPDVGKSVAPADLEALKTFYGSHEGPPLWVTEEGFTPKAQAIIAEIEKADEWGLDAKSFELPPPNDLLATPNAHADDELQLSIAILSYARDAQIGRLTPSRVSKLFDQHPSLRDPKTVLTEAAAADDPSAYLVSLHPQHDQFKRLHAALAKARASAEASGGNPNNDERVQRIIINMERWRWLPRSLGAFHVWNNIPEFNARVMKNGKVIYSENTIVGELKYATPFFSAPMRNIVFHPDWTVPPTIVKEDLAPKLEQGGGGGFFGGGPAAALRRHGLSVSLAGQPVDANAVDWKNENIHRYTFTQAPGPANVLGKLKFNFPNRHAIYMHDTIEPELFAKTVRTLSHGCIRVQDPDQFAALLLGEDKGWSHSQVMGLLARNETSVVSLNRHIPVHLTYFTAVVDENGNVNTFSDPYGIDNRMAASLFDNPAKFHVPPPQVVESAPRTQRRQGGGGGLDGIISGLFGN